MFNKEDQKPVYVINGFLDAGKSSFFAYTLGQPYFQTEGTTLLILCEEGEVEFTESLLKKSKTEVEVIDSLEDFTPANLMALEVKHRPERILIEWNGMWDFKAFTLPRKWRLEQQITCINAATFSVYFTNMRSLIAEQLRNSELIMFNRCDGMDEKVLANYKRNVKAINQQGMLVFENADGEIDMTMEEDLPYDINQNPIPLEGINYGIWYIDAMEHPDRYAGKEVTFTGMVAMPPDYPGDYFVPGRMAMTCCAQDMQFLGYACKKDKVSDGIQEKDWVKMTAKVMIEPVAPYGRDGVVLHPLTLEKTEEPKDAIINFGA